MHKSFMKISAFLFALLLGGASALPVSAADDSLSTEEPGEVVISDEADLLTDSEEADLLEIMKPITQYGHALFYSTNTNEYDDTYDLSKAAYASFFSEYDDGVIFTIDMDDRQLWISGFGECQYMVTDSYCYTITDNVYTYATGGDYYECAAQGFEQIYAVLQGKDIPQPMRYTCNFLLAIAIALVINFLIVTSYSKKRTPSLSSVKDSMIYHCDIHNPQATFTHERKVYNPPSSSSGSSSGGGGGGGGGGSASSSGGGHSF